MNYKKVTFTNKNNIELSGRIELPLNQEPHNFVLFAHCFTGNKNLLSVRNISRAMTQTGFGVLRFDFTGLGESEGDFADTNFTGNVEDLIAAAEFLTKNYKAPTLLIGHSLGGAAVIFAAARLENIKAVATINAPSNPIHVKHLLKDSLAEINKKGYAVVNLGGRDFTIQKQFLDDLKTKSLPKVVATLDEALLVLHSPQDTLVGIENAEEIYKAARHPKSFVSLDGANHLLTKKKDSQYVGQLIASWATRYVEIPPPEELHSKSKVAANLDFNENFTTRLKMGDHYFNADEPTKMGGNNYGPTPYEFLSAGLAACTAMTLQMYARRKKWDLKSVDVYIDYSKEYATDCENCEEDAAKIDTFTREISLSGNLSEGQKNKLLEIADKCPVHKTLHSETQVITRLISE